MKIKIIPGDALTYRSGDKLVTVFKDGTTESHDYLESYQASLIDYLQREEIDPQLEMHLRQMLDAVSAFNRKRWDKSLVDVCLAICYMAKFIRLERRFISMYPNFSFRKNRSDCN